MFSIKLAAVVMHGQRLIRLRGDVAVSRHAAGQLDQRER